MTRRATIGRRGIQNVELRHRRMENALQPGCVQDRERAHRSRSSFGMLLLHEYDATTKFSFGCNHPVEIYSRRERSSMCALGAYLEFVNPWGGASATSK